MKILLLKGLSQYDALRNYIDNWDAILQKKGHETYVLDAACLSAPDSLGKITSQFHPDIILSCNAICSMDITDFSDNMGKYVTVLYDNPIVQKKRLCNLGQNSVVFSCDRIYADYIRKTYPNIGTVGFLPLSGNGAADAHIPCEQRKYELVFTGSYLNVNAAYDTLKNLPDGVRELFLDVVDYMTVEPNKVLWEALDAVIQKWGISFNKAEYADVLDNMGCIDYYMRAFFRDKMIRAALKADVPVHIFGNGWDKFHDARKKYLILEEGYGNTALNMLGNTKISLNIMPWFRAGIQERNISAMLSGAVSLSDSSLYIEEEFCDGQDIVLYSLKNLEILPEKITELLEHPELCSAIAKAGYQKAMQKHTWECRIQDMLNTLETME